VSKGVPGPEAFSPAPGSVGERTVSKGVPGPEAFSPAPGSVGESTVAKDMRSLVEDTEEGEAF